MIYMRMCQKHIINIRHIHGKFLILIIVGSLFHSAVNKYVLVAGLNNMAAAGNFVVSSDKSNFHVPLHVIYYSLVVNYLDNYFTIFLPKNKYYIYKWMHLVL